MEDVSQLAFAGVVLAPLFVGFVGLLKRITEDPRGNLWLAVSVALAMLGQGAVFIASNGVPQTFAEILTLVILGLAFGLATSKVYDETLGRKGG